MALHSPGALCRLLRHAAGSSATASPAEPPHHHCSNDGAGHQPATNLAPISGPVSNHQPPPRLETRSDSFKALSTGSLTQRLHCLIGGPLLRLDPATSPPTSILPGHSHPASDLHSAPSPPAARFSVITTHLPSKLQAPGSRLQLPKVSRPIPAFSPAPTSRHQPPAVSDRQYLPACPPLNRPTRRRTGLLHLPPTP